MKESRFSSTSYFFVNRGSRRDSSMEFRFGCTGIPQMYTRKPKQYNFPFVTSMLLSTFNFFTVAWNGWNKRSTNSRHDARRWISRYSRVFHRCYKFARIVSNLLYRSRSILRSQLLSTSCFFFFFFFFFYVFYTRVTKLDKVDNDKITR